MTCAWQRNSSLFLMILIATCSFLILRGASKADPQCPSTQPRTCATLFQRNGAKSQRHCEYSHRSQPERDPAHSHLARLARTPMGCEMCSASGITLGQRHKRVYSPIIRLYDNSERALANRALDLVPALWVCTNAYNPPASPVRPKDQRENSVPHRGALRTHAAVCAHDRYAFSASERERRLCTGC
jgi:hypothetical protein